MHKYILVSGGVISGVGKGIIASCTGLLLKSHGYNITHVKIDPYLNIDPGTINPYEHGECFVLEDGGETDLDLGNYERFAEIKLTRDHNITTGKIYQQVISNERKGVYLGKTVQVVPHITDAIINWIEHVAKIPVNKDVIPEVCIIELGGTVGDIESMPFIEALRQMQFKHRKLNNFCSIHVGLIVNSSGEQKTKPIQQSVQSLRHYGISPDILVCRCEQKLEPDIVTKIENFCQADVVSAFNVDNLYLMPHVLYEQGFNVKIMNILNIKDKESADSLHIQHLNNWNILAYKYAKLKRNVHIHKLKLAIIGKYIELPDAYLSIFKAIEHAMLQLNTLVEICLINSETIVDYEHAGKLLEEFQGIIVPGGFGDRGIEGMLIAIEYARRNNIPFLGICLGMQLAVIETARNKLNMTYACSEEFSKNIDDVVVFIPEINKDKIGGTMKLGMHTTILNTKHCHSYRLYNDTSIHERHRHRYEINPVMIDKLSPYMQFVGMDGRRVDIVEIKELKYFVGCQFHPEFTSSPYKPAPYFVGLISAMMQ